MSIGVESFNFDMLVDEGMIDEGGFIPFKFVDFCEEAGK